MLRKAIVVIIVVFVVVSILQSPQASAAFVQDIVGLLILGVQQILAFFDSLVAG